MNTKPIRVLGNAIHPIGYPRINTITLDRRVINAMAKANFYWCYKDGKQNVFLCFPQKTIDAAIKWWSSLSVRDCFKTCAKPCNLQWKDKGETGIIQMYLNSLK